MAKYWAKKFKNVLLIGLPSSGKTTFGKVYAHHSGRHFLDLDDYIEHVTKKSISTLFQESSEETFREIEESCFLKLERRHNYVISLGGGTIHTPQLLLFARRLGLVVSLKAPLDILANRILSQQQSQAVIRPLFQKLTTPQAVLEKLKELEEKRTEYFDKADVILNTHFNSLDTLSLQLALIEKNAANRHYMADVMQIIQLSKKNTSKDAEKEGDVPTVSIENPSETIEHESNEVESESSIVGN